MPRLLIVSNCPSPNTQRLQQAVVRGTQHVDITEVVVIAKQPLEAAAQDIFQADGIIVGTTENFGYMSGLIKDFFERIYYPCLEKTAGLPAALFVKGGLDGQGAKTSVERIVTGLKWKLVQPTLVMQGEFNAEFVTQCEQLGTYVAAGLEAKIF